MFFVEIYFILLYRNNLITFENKTLLNFLKISFATFVMCFFLYFGLDYFEDKFQYAYKFKLIYLLIVVGSSAALYLLITKILGVLNLKNYKINER